MNPISGSLLVPEIRLPSDYGKLEELSRLLTEDRVAGFCVFGGDRELLPPFLRRLRDVAKRPILIMADFEHGAGRMVEGMPELPPAMAIAATGSAESAYMAGKITALSARHLSIGVVLAPVLDVLSNAKNPILGTRAFSDDPDLVTRLGLAFIEGVQEEGVIACAKHFPGHGATTLDSHISLPRVDADLQELIERDLAPFRAAVRAGVGMVMTAHVVYDALDPDIPATFSPAVVSTLLREEWGYGGLVISDALTMEGAAGGEEDPSVRALAAGIDLLLCPRDEAASMRAVDEALSSGRLSAASLTMSQGKASMAAGDQLSDAPAKKDLSREYGFEIEKMARNAITLGGDPDRLLPRLAKGGADVLGLVLDDDGIPRRAHLFAPRADDFTGGVIHVTAQGTGVAGDVASALRRADVIVMGLVADVHAGKGRATLGPELTGFALQVLRDHPKKTLVLDFGAPALVEDLPAGNVVFAYGEVESLRRAALDAVFDGGPMPGRLPAAAGWVFPRGTGVGDAQMLP